MKTGIYISMILLVFNLNAQTSHQANKSFQQSQIMAQQGDYKGAMQLMKRVYKQYPQSPEVLYSMGDIYLNTPGGTDSAAVYFDKAYQYLPETDRNSVIGADIQIARAHSYHLLLRPDDAIEAYKNLQKYLPEGSTELRATTDREIEMCLNLKEAMKKPVKLEVQNIGSSINSRNEDHSPLLSLDGRTLFFTSRRPSSYSQIMPDGQYSEKIFYSVNDSSNNSWSKPKEVNRLFKAQGHEAGVSLSPDGQELYIFRNNNDGKNLYSSQFDGKKWTEPMKLPKPINTDYDETHATVNADKTVMYFTSNRPGGFGGLDIYQVRRLPDGSWSKAMNLGETINTKYDDEAPMLHPDGISLYFASQGHKSIGGYDIFVSQLSKDTVWSTPVNLGFPINTPDDELFFAPSITRNRAYFASSRFAGGQGGMDIYLLEYEDPIENRLAVISGNIDCSMDMPLETVKILVTDKATGNKEGEYRPHPGTGDYVLILESGKTYNLQYTGDGMQEMSTDLNVQPKMSFVAGGKKIEINKVVLNSIIPEVTVALAAKTPDSNGKKMYTVQILALSGPCKSWSKVFNGIDKEQIKEYQCNDQIYRYAFGTYKSYRAAMKARDEVVEKTSFDDAFIKHLGDLEKMMETSK